jgi:two-component system osmolarity sensor histidine kinase EnvZ
MTLMDEIGNRLRLDRLRQHAPALQRLRSAIGGSLSRAVRPLNRLLNAANKRLPKGLYARSILIVVTPIVILQSVVAYVFMERHWERVTQRLSAAVTQDIAAIVEMIETYPQDERYSDLTRIAADSLGLTISVLPDGPLPAAGRKPFFSLLDRALSRQITKRIKRPFWIDTVGDSDLVEIRIKLDGKILRVFARRSQAYASNSHIFLVWMIGTSLVLIGIALAFLRNQIKPILTLAEAADGFGKGRQVAEFRLRGAREVRQASQAFIDMRRRIERQIEQRTAMLSGVSHDLRTILTRFKLELALLGDNPDTRAMRADIDEMARMLEDYLAFAKGDAEEGGELVDMPALLEELAERARRAGNQVTVAFQGEAKIQVRPMAFRRCLDNLIGNAGKFGDRIDILANHQDGWLTITIDDDGPGIAEDEREAVFKPFYRLDTARNVDDGGTGLGLSIARDLARSHGGDIALDASPLGGLRAMLAIPA